MLRCSEATGVSGFSPAGDPSLSDMLVGFVREVKKDGSSVNTRLDGESGLVGSMKDEV
jgi:hypothetical protein